MALGGTGSISFGGLASGLETKDIIDKLVNVKKTQLLAPLDNRIAQLNAQKTALAPIKSAFTSMLNQARRMSDPVNNVLSLKSAVSSVPATVSIGAITSTKAIKGTYTLSNISQLAQADRVIFSGIAERNTAVGTGTFDITYKDSTTAIQIDSSHNTLEGIVSAINSADIGVTASIINDGSATPYRLVLTANDTGADTAITHTIDSVLPLAVDAVASSGADNEPQDAAFEINGITNFSRTNTVTEAIQGVTFSLLHTETEDSVNITVSQDTTLMASRITDFISSYNEVRMSMKTALLPDSNGKLGVLGGDSALATANVKIANVMGTIFKTFINDNYNTLSKIGVTADTTSGLLSVDAAKLKAALESDPENVRRIFQGNAQESGIATKMKDYSVSILSGTGLFFAKEKNIAQTIKTLTTRKEDKQDYIDSYEDRLNRRYNNLETVLANLKNQESQIAGFAGIYTNSSNNLL